MATGKWRWRQKAFYEQVKIYKDQQAQQVQQYILLNQVPHKHQPWLIQYIHPNSDKIYFLTTFIKATEAQTDEGLAPRHILEMGSITMWHGLGQFSLSEKLVQIILGAVECQKEKS